jgi:hypothetical protein
MPNIGHVKSHGTFLRELLVVGIFQKTVLRGSRINKGLGGYDTSQALYWSAFKSLASTNSATQA